MAAITLVGGRKPDRVPRRRRARLPEPDEAAPELIAAYLGAYGPSTPEVIGAWLYRSAIMRKTLRRWFAAMGDRLTTVEVDRQTRSILAEHADELARPRARTSVRLLGAFDQYILAPGTNGPQLLPAVHRAKVSDPGPSTLDDQ